MNLNVSEWKEFKISSLFKISGTKTTSIEDLDEQQIYPYITTQAGNNGVESYSSFYTEKGNVLTVDSAVLGQCFYQKENFTASDHVEKLTPLFDMSIFHALFIQTIINGEKYKYCYGRKRSQKVLKQEVIKLPIEYETNNDGTFKLDKDNNKIPILDPTHKYSDEGFIPDFKFMEDYIKSLNSKPITTSNGGGVNHIPLVVEEWKEFKVRDIFNIKRGNTLSSDDKDEFIGNIPCINGSAENNGLLCKLNEKAPLDLIQAPALSLSRVGNSGMTFYQNENFFIADNAFALHLKHIDANKYHYLFISTILNKELFKYSYGRTVTIDKYLETNILLPIKNNEPDWTFMENYIKSLPYGDKIA